MGHGLRSGVGRLGSRVARCGVVVGCIIHMRATLMTPEGGSEMFGARPGWAGTAKSWEAHTPDGFLPEGVASSGARDVLNPDAVKLVATT